MAGEDRPFNAENDDAGDHSQVRLASHWLPYSSELRNKDLHPVSSLELCLVKAWMDR